MSILIRKFNDSRATKPYMDESETPEALPSKKQQDGFAITSYAFGYFLEYNSIDKLLSELMENIDKENFSNLKEMSWWANRLVMNGRMPVDLANAIKAAYKELNVQSPFEVAVKSNAISKNPPFNEATFSHIKNESELLTAIQKSFASFYDEGAIKFRMANELLAKNVSMEVEVKSEIDYEQFFSRLKFSLQPQPSLNAVHGA
jgi:pyruvate,water dikinase